MAAIIEAFSAFVVAGGAMGAVVVKVGGRAAKRFVVEVITPELSAMRQAVEGMGSRVAHLEWVERTRGLNVSPPDEHHRQDDSG